MECNSEVRHQEGTLKRGGTQLSLTKNEAAGVEDFVLKSKTPAQRGAEIASWASKKRNVEQGEPEGGKVATSLNIFKDAEILKEQMKWSTPKRALLDGGDGKHVVCLDGVDFVRLDGVESARRSKSQRRRRRQRVKTSSDTIQGRIVTNVPISGDDMFPAPGELTASKTSKHASAHNKEVVSHEVPRSPQGHTDIPKAHTAAVQGRSAHTTAVKGMTVGEKPHEEFGGLIPPTLDSGREVTGANKEKHRLENKRKRQAKQAQQEPVNYWEKYRGHFSMPTPAKAPDKWRGNMCPSGLALHHEAAGLLLKYATEGCPTDTGKQWTVEQMTMAVERGPHQSATDPEAMEYFQQEVMEKVKQGQVTLVNWDDIKSNPPPELKVSPIALIPHKSRKFRAILDLSFAIKLKNGDVAVPSVNSTSIKTAPAGAIDQMGHALQRIIHAFAQAPENAKIFSAKWDIKDGFWRLDCQQGEEWNFAYVLPQAEGKPIKLIVPTSLQMGWIESPPFFCAASETGRDVAAEYVETPVGSLTDHKFVEHAAQGADYGALPATSTDKRLAYLLEVYVDDYIALAIPTSQEQLRHVANAVMHGVHDVFPPNEDANNDALSFKKLLKLEGMWALVKDILGFTFDGLEKTIWLEEPKRDALLTTLQGWLRAAHRREAGVPFGEFQSVIAKLRHAFTSIPSGKGLLSPCNTVMRLEPEFVYLHRNQPLQEAITDCRTLLRESTLAPTKCAELVTGWPDFVGIKDASSHGVGGIIVGENVACIPTVFRAEWPDDIKRLYKTGSITNSDLECAGLLLLWLIMEDVCPLKVGSRVGLFSDNSPTVSWVQRLASRRSKVAAQLIRALALRLKKQGAAPLTPLHIPGVENAVADIPSRSFGSEPKWHCRSNDELLTLFNKTFPLPNQHSWTVYQPTNGIFMRICSVLRTKPSKLEEWRRLPKIGKHSLPTGVPLSNLWEWTLRFRGNHSTSEQDVCQGSQPSSALDTLVEETKSKVVQYQRRSLPLARRSRWPMGKTPQKR